MVKKGIQFPLTFTFIIFFYFHPMLLKRNMHERGEMAHGRQIAQNAKLKKPSARTARQGFSHGTIRVLRNKSQDKTR